MENQATQLVLALFDDPTVRQQVDGLEKDRRSDWFKVAAALTNAALPRDTEPDDPATWTPAAYFVRQATSAFWQQVDKTYVYDVLFNGKERE